MLAALDLLEHASPASCPGPLHLWSMLAQLAALALSTSGAPSPASYPGPLH